MVDLKNAMAGLESAKVEEPALLEEEPTVEINAEMSRDELNQIKEE